MNYEELNRILGDDFHEDAEEINDIDGYYHLLLDPEQLRVSGDFVYDLSKGDGGALSAGGAAEDRYQHASR